MPVAEVAYREGDASDEPKRSIQGQTMVIGSNPTSVAACPVLALVRPAMEPGLA